MVFIGRNNALVALPYLELYHRLFDQKGNKFVTEDNGTVTDKLDHTSFYNILLLVAIVMTYAVDTSICERGFALMNNLKTARRSQMGNMMLRTLMIICELGDEWSDPTKIPVDAIVEEWRAQSKKGRYESAMWRAAGLEEPHSKGAKSTSQQGAEEEEKEVDPGTFEYDWDGRARARERAFPSARPAGEAAGSSGSAGSAYDSSDSDESDD